MASVFEPLCNADNLVATSLGLKLWEYALVSSIVSGALASGFLATWLFTFGKLRSAGIARRQQRLVWWFAVTITLTQISLTMLAGDGVTLMPCPWSLAVLPFISVLFVSMAWALHLEDKNKASPATYFGMVVLPLLGEVGVTTKWAVGGTIKAFMILLGHLH